VTKRVTLGFSIDNKPPDASGPRVAVRLPCSDHDRVRDKIADKMGADIGRELAAYLRTVSLSDMLNHAIWPELHFDPIVARKRGGRKKGSHNKEKAFAEERQLAALVNDMSAIELAKTFLRAKWAGERSLGDDAENLAKMIRRDRKKARGQSGK